MSLFFVPPKWLDTESGARLFRRPMVEDSQPREVIVDHQLVPIRSTLLMIGLILYS